MGRPYDAAAERAQSLRTVPLASLARFFHLAAIRPDKSRGASLPTFKLGAMHCAVNAAFL
jgi:hypothetical protein